MKVQGHGPCDARIMIVGEAPGEEEERKGKPFVGTSGWCLDQMLHDAGIIRSECYVTNVCKYRPQWNDITKWVSAKELGGWHYHAPSAQWISPEVWEGVQELNFDVERLKPNVIIALGNTPLWALTGKHGVGTWRGSLVPSLHPQPFKVIPTYHPAAVLRQWAWRWDTVQDLRRANAESLWPEIRKPAWNFHIRPTMDQVLGFLDNLGESVVCDIETRKRQITCVGIGDKRSEAMCIPIFGQGPDSSYWRTAEEEFFVVRALLDALGRRKVINQNFLYDAFYIAALWGRKIIPVFDTMIAQGVLFPGFPKSLDYLASLHCQYYYYWKHDSKEWQGHQSYEDLWTYNCQDIAYTWECHDSLDAALTQTGLREQFNFEMQLFEPCLTYMLRGINSNSERRKELSADMLTAMNRRTDSLAAMFGHPVNPRSPKQLQSLFYEDLGVAPIRKRASRKNPNPNYTTDDEALEKIKLREPLLVPAINKIQEIRTMGIFRSNFLEAESPDNRFYTGVNIVGTKTFRYSNSTNPMYYGCVTPGTEVLTSIGWKAIETLADGESVATWQPTGVITFSPSRHHIADAVEVLTVQGEQVYQELTPQHRVPFWTKRGEFEVAAAQIVSTRARIKLPLAGTLQDFNGRLPFPRLLVAALADGSYDGRQVRFAFKKQRKAQRLQQLCEEYGIELREYSDKREAYTRWAFDKPAAWPVEKSWGSWILYVSASTRQELLEELKYWDGLERNRSTWFFTASHEQAEWVATMAHLANRSATITRHEQSEASWSDTIMYTVNIKPRNVAWVDPKHWSTKEYSGKVYCVSVPSTFFLIRKNGFISVTGNTNLQNVPKFEEDEAHLNPDLPDIRKLFLPDEGYTLAEFDLSKADLRVVVWESDEKELKQMLREGVNIYKEAGTKITGMPYRRAKMFIHGSDYGGTPRTMAVHCGITVHQAELAQRKWFGAYPGIKEWHERVRNQLFTTSSVSNQFGFRIIFADRVDGLLPEALAWVPQSTVAIVINKVLEKFYYTIERRFKHSQLLLQVHDSILIQIQNAYVKFVIPAVLNLFNQVVVPYADPLIIPGDCKFGSKSWAELEKWNAPAL